MDSNVNGFSGTALRNNNYISHPELPERSISKNKSRTIAISFGLLFTLALMLLQVFNTAFDEPEITTQQLYGNSTLKLSDALNFAVIQEGRFIQLLATISAGSSPLDSLYIWYSALRSSPVSFLSSPLRDFLPRHLNWHAEYPELSIRPCYLSGRWCILNSIGTNIPIS